MASDLFGEIRPICAMKIYVYSRISNDRFHLQMHGSSFAPGIKEKTDAAMC